MDEREKLFERGFLACLPSLAFGDSTIPLEASGLRGQATKVGLSSDNYKWGWWTGIAGGGLAAGGQQNGGCCDG